MDRDSAVDLVVLEVGPMTDEQRERLINSCQTILECAIEREWKVWAADRMRELIAERSPQQVARMECERGLRAP